MTRHIVFGAGQVGPEIVRQLAQGGEPVTVATRSGRDLGIPGVTSAAADATDPASVRAAAAGADVAYFAVQPEYTRWPEGFPPLAEGIIGGLSGTGTRLVVVDNLYLYGDTLGAPVTEALPAAAKTRKGGARARLAARFMAAHEAGDVPVTIGRAADFFGPTALDTIMGERFFGHIVAGKPADVLGDPDTPHMYSYLPDFARALIELGRHESALGRAWHVPNAPAVTTRHFAQMAADAAGVPLKLNRLSPMMLRLAGLFIPPAREMVELTYEWEHPYVVDSSAFASAFGLAATPLETSIPATVDWYRAHETTARTA